LCWIGSLVWSGLFFLVSALAYLLKSRIPTWVNERCNWNTQQNFVQTFASDCTDSSNNSPCIDSCTLTVAQDLYITCTGMTLLISIAVLFFGYHAKHLSNKWSKLAADEDTTEQLPGGYQAPANDPAKDAGLGIGTTDLLDADKDSKDPEDKSNKKTLFDLGDEFLDLSFKEPQFEDPQRQKSLSDPTPLESGPTSSIPTSSFHWPTNQQSSGPESLKSSHQLFGEEDSEMKDNEDETVVHVLGNHPRRRLTDNIQGKLKKSDSQLTSINTTIQDTVIPKPRSISPFTTQSSMSSTTGPSSTPTKGTSSMTQTASYGTTQVPTSSPYPRVGIPRAESYPVSASSTGSSGSSSTGTRVTSPRSGVPSSRSNTDIPIIRILPTTESTQSSDLS